MSGHERSHPALLAGWRRAARRLGLVVATALAAAACAAEGPAKPGSGDPAGGGDYWWPGDVDVVQDGTLRLNSVFPASGPLQGGTLIDVIGTGMRDGMRVLVNGDDCTDVLYRGPNRYTARTPAGPFGPVDVAVVDLAGAAVLHGGFSYFHPVTVSAIEPATVLSTGGTRLRVFGTGFSAAAQVFAGTAAASSVQVVSETELSARLPVLPSGLLPVGVVDMNGGDTLPGALRVMEPVRVTAVLPMAGPLAGGYPVSVLGSGFIDGTSLWFDGVSVAVVARAADGAQLEAVVPDAASEGAVDVLAANDFGRSLLLDGFVYVDTSNPTARVVAVAPRAGPVVGGTAVTIIGVGFDGASDVFFGAAAATCDAASDFVLRCVAPPGGEGAVDVTVHAPAGTLVLPDGFIYVAIELDSVQPALGSIAGGTYVSVIGRGFDAGTQVFFNDAPAAVLLVAGPEALAVATPPGAVGPARVRVTRLGVSAERDGLFEYFDPASEIDWTSGGKIDGAVNVWVSNAYTGQGVEGAYVVIGADAEPAYKGYTDARGLLTLSGPDLAGPITITAAKPTYSNQSYVNVDAQNIQFWLFPPPEAVDPTNTDVDPPDPQPQPLPPRVRGQVKRIKGEGLEAGTTVWVFTSNRWSGALGGPLQGGLVSYTGPFDVTTRPGEQALIALAGTPDPVTGILNVQALGMRPFLYLLNDQVYDNQDITIDTAVNQPFSIALVDPPLGMPDGPTTAAVTLTFDLGAMGFLNWPRVVGSSTTMTVNLPLELPHQLGQTPLLLRGGVYGSGLSVPMSEVWEPSVTDWSSELVLAPFLGTLTPKEPAEGGSLLAPSGPAYRFEVLTNAAPVPTLHYHSLYDGLDGVLRWTVITSGSTYAFDLPVLDTVTQGERFKAAAHTWYLQSLYVPGLTLDAVDSYRLSDWRSRAYSYTYFLAQ